MPKWYSQVIGIHINFMSYEMEYKIKLNEKMNHESNDESS